MNPWKILELEPTSDAREIKRAYAKKLKVTKPDEKPAEFQILHEAYKTALHYAHYENDGDSVSVHSEPDAVVTTPDIESSTSNTVGIPGNIAAESDIEFTNVDPVTDINEEEFKRARDLHIKEFEGLIERVEFLLRDNQKISDLREWSFLSQSPYLLEDEFNWQLGLQIFKLFAEYGQQPRKRSGGGGRYYRSVSSELVNYCAELFSWRTNSFYLQQELGEDVCRAIFDQMHEPYEWQQPVQQARGGVMVRGEARANTRPKQKSYTSVWNHVFSVMQFLFFVFMGLHFLRSIGIL